MGTEYYQGFCCNYIKFLLPQKAGRRYDAARHRLPARSTNLIGEPGHTKPPAARLRHGVSNSGLFWVCAS